MSPSMTHEIQATNRIFEQEVAAQRNVQALDRVYTTKARILPPGTAMVEGRENIKTFWRGAFEALFAECPGIRDRLVNEEGQLRAHINVFVGNDDVRYTGGLSTPLPAEAEISILPAVSGG